MTEYPWTKEEVQIIKACWASEPGRIALQLVVERLGVLHGDSYDDNPSRMAWIAGRRYVARELMAAINNPVEKIAKEPHEPRSNRPITATERAARAAAAGHDAVPGRSGTGKHSRT